MNIAALNFAARTCAAGFLLLALLVAVSSCPAIAAPPEGLSAEVYEQLTKDLAALKARGAKLRSAQESPAPAELDLLADADIFCKALTWALDYEPKLEPKDIAILQQAIQRGGQRLDALQAGQHPWAEKKGKLARGYLSAVDGSTQPYGLIIPAGYDKQKPIRLDVVLHGSQKVGGLNELRHLAKFEEESDKATPPPEVEFIELHPLGRVENCYRWAGETDVFEAIESVCRNYNIDRDRIVLRGFSMGASGTWHLGLKHPATFVALGPYCGYVDTYEMSHTPISTFIKVEKLPPHQDSILHMLDSKDYAANAGVVPAIACMGDKDVFFQAHVIMEQAMKQEGLTMVNFIAKGFAHTIDPVTFQEEMRQIKTYADQGLNHTPEHIRFVTWTLKYNRCHWLAIVGLEHHYQRAELDATVKGDTIVFQEPKNITAFAVSLKQFKTPIKQLLVGESKIPLPANAAEQGTWLIGKVKDSWEPLTPPFNEQFGVVRLEGKRPGLQGPIDDAFTAPFLCVRGTGQPMHPQVDAWAKANLAAFQHTWRKYMRGDLPVKDDKDVTDDDIRNYHLILFGDPGSNSLVGRVVQKMGWEWTAEKLTFGGKEYSANDHLPVMIYPNPLPLANKERYIVLNTGHTFHEQEFASINYLLFPRLGDWAVLKVGETKVSAPEQPPADVADVGFFDEQWQFPASNQRSTP